VPGLGQGSDRLAVKVIAAARIAAQPAIRQLAQRVQSTGMSLSPVADVDDIETALEIAARGLADTIASRGLLRGLGGDYKLHAAPLRPRMWDSFAVVHRRQTDLSPAARAVLELAVAFLKRRT